MADKKRAFYEKCYELYENKMYHIAFGILKDEGLAEDTVHDTFISMIQAGVYFDEAESMHCKYYIAKALKNTAINVYRKLRLEETQFFLMDDDSFSIIDEKAYNDDMICTGILINEYINRLPEKYREIISCLAIEELSVKDTANRLDISTTLVRKRHERAIKLLRKYIKKEDNLYD